MILPANPSSPVRVPAARRFTAAAAALLALTSLAQAASRAPFLAPEEALKAFQLEPGLRIELVAAEPLVVDPVAFAFDERGRLFVVENRGYPGPLKGNQAAPDPEVTPEGRIALLEDTNGDGRFDRRTDYATGLTYPNGLALWRGGVFVTCAPDILYLKDTDGDGVADQRQVVLTGFETSRTTQIRVSHPTLGLDGKFYVTSGLNGGKIVSPLHPDREPVTFSPADGRFDPDTQVYERTGGRGQFGLTFDAFGRRFICSNRHPVLQVVLEPWHLRRNPHLAATDTTQEVSKVEAQARVFPVSRSAVTADFIPNLMSKPHAGTFTAASGTHVFGGTALRPEHTGNVFICESAQNLVQRQVLRPDGASFRSDPAYEGREFLASTDVWFRPVFLGDGPDGALYVADMHRREIDHPQYVPEESRHLLDFESGKGTGRIYRIVREGRSAPPPSPAQADTIEDLLRGLESPDAWWRMRSFRLLRERADPAAAPGLAQRAAGAARPETRAAALWALHGLGQVSEAVLARVLRDDDAGVREQAVQLAGPRLDSSPGLLGAVLAAAGDPDPRVRFNVALVLGSVSEPRAVGALAAIAARDGTDRWTRTAVLSGVGSRQADFLTALQTSPSRSPAAYAAVTEDLGRGFGAGASLEACTQFFAEMTKDDGSAAQLPAVAGLVEGMRGRAEFKGKPVEAILATFRPEDVDRLLQFSTTLAASASAPKQTRAGAVVLLGYAGFERSGAALGALLDARHPPEIQIQAVRALDRLGDPRGAELLVVPANWSRYTASVREAVIATLTSKPKMTEVLFAAIRRGAIQPAEISSLRRTQLQKHSDPGIRKSATTLFQELEGGDRMKVYRELREHLSQPADGARGAEVFARACAACHTFHGIGGKVGPDLSGVRHQPADALLLHTLVPNYEVVPAYQTITVTLDDGRTVSGWLAGETDHSLTLRTAAGPEETLLRKDIASLVTSGLSLMPDGLEQTMTRNELLDLIAYLKSEPAAR